MRGDRGERGGVRREGDGAEGGEGRRVREESGGG